MNLALGLVFLVTVVLLDGVKGLSKKEHSDNHEIVDSNKVAGVLPDSGTGLSRKQLSDDNGFVDSNKMKALSRRGRGFCRRKLSGRCVRRRKRCPGQFPSQTSPGRPYCSRFHRCCHPAVESSCNTDDMISIGSENFMVFDDIALYWEVANQRCLDAGLVMAEPLDPVAVADYLWYNFDHIYIRFWLGARGNGTTFVWNSGSILPSSSPYWATNLPGSLVRTDNCVTTGPRTSPYHIDICDQSKYHAICQCPN